MKIWLFRHLDKRVCPSVGRAVGRSVTLSLKLQKTAKFTENHGSLHERTTNKGSVSINESCTQSITHSNHSCTSQGASLAYLGLVQIHFIIFKSWDMLFSIVAFGVIYPVNSRISAKLLVGTPKWNFFPHKWCNQGFSSPKPMNLNRFFNHALTFLA